MVQFAEEEKRAGEPRLEDADDGLGARVRAARQRRRLTLRDVATEAGLSESFLSQLERGRVNPSVASLQRIAAALKTSVGDLFSAPPGRTGDVLRRTERPRLDFGEGCFKELISPPWMDQIEFITVTFEVGGSTGAEAYAHGDSEEVCLVVDGTVELRIDDRVHRLEAGDSAGYVSSVPHRVTNVGAGPAKAIFVISPPSY